MTKYAITFSEDDDVIVGCFEGGTNWTEFFHADDPDRAIEQAKDANPRATILAVAAVID